MAALNCLRVPGTASGCVGLAATPTAADDSIDSKYLAAYADGTISVVSCRDANSSEHIHIASLASDCRFLTSATSSRVSAVACTRAESRSTVHMLSVANGALHVQPVTVAGMCTSIALSGTTLSVGNDTGDIQDRGIDSSASQWAGRCFGGSGPSVRALAHWSSSDAKLMAACGPSVHVFDKRTNGAAAAAVLAQSDGAGPLGPAVTCLSLDQDDPWLVMGGTAEGAVCAWDLRQAQQPIMAPVVLHSGAVRAMAVGRFGGVSAGSSILSAGDDGAVVLYTPNSSASNATAQQQQRTVLMQAEGALRGLLVHRPGRLKLTSPNAVLVSAGGDSGIIETSTLGAQ